jgi:hypothetical protein
MNCDVSILLRCRKNSSECNEKFVQDFLTETWEKQNKKNILQMQPITIPTFWYIRLRWCVIEYRHFEVPYCPQVTQGSTCSRTVLPETFCS